MFWPSRTRDATLSGDAAVDAGRLTLDALACRPRRGAGQDRKQAKIEKRLLAEFSQRVLVRPSGGGGIVEIAEGAADANPRAIAFIGVGRLGLFSG